jgi:4a-hydroxytetrahydrobiopterin dehydratase
MANTDKLSQSEILEQLQSLTGWNLDDGRLYRELKFADFVRAFGFMASVATIAQAMDHHPDWSNSYNVVRIYLISHDVKGISKRDIALASKINELAP